ncbi:hypothetical protein E4U43_006456 [Claviceps pusilla]|uniref:Uncharacterized protein n=1 Tax=Claviceps pusilla TaxID=123648 RepID=A0A9P7N3C1_9HYPO|nr:hypothetical protein E4U43_006456 [Claviceps pusilla]
MKSNVRVGEDGRQAKARADALRQQDLIVLRSKRAHHQPRDVEQGAEEVELSRSVPVVYGAEDKALGIKVKH